MDFQGKSFLKEIDFTKEELTYLIDLAIHLKKLKKNRIPHQYLQGQNIALVFEKTSTRTRSAFTVAANDLGAYPEFLGQGSIQLGTKESVIDTAKVLGSMFDGIQYRGFNQADVEALAAHAGVPVWNGLTDEWHPTQMIADFMTLKEVFGKLEGLSLAYYGDGRNNMAHSLLVTGAILGVNITIVSPQKLSPAPDIVEMAKDYASKSGATITLTSDVSGGARGADAVYTDVWISMGEEAQTEERIKLLKDYQVTESIMKTAEPDAIFLHCLPAFHDQNTSLGVELYEKYGLKELEVTDGVFQAPYSKQFQQAENRMHSIKAIMVATNGNLFFG